MQITQRVNDKREGKEKHVTRIQINDFWNIQVAPTKRLTGWTFHDFGRWYHWIKPTIANYRPPLHFQLNPACPDGAIQREHEDSITTSCHESAYHTHQHQHQHHHQHHHHHQQQQQQRHHQQYPRDDQDDHHDHHDYNEDDDDHYHQNDDDNDDDHDITMTLMNYYALNSDWQKALLCTEGTCHTMCDAGIVAFTTSLKRLFWRTPFYRNLLLPQPLKRNSTLAMQGTWTRKQSATHVHMYCCYICVFEMTLYIII